MKQNVNWNRSMRGAPVVLAVLLQLAPMARHALPEFLTAPGAVMFLRWVIGAVAVAGSVDAVSGGSTVVSTPLRVNGTNGVPLSADLRTRGHAARSWTATGIPPGLSLTGTPGSTGWQIEGTPATVGQFVTRVTGHENAGGSGRSVSANMVFNILPGPADPPAIVASPTNRTVEAGQTVEFSATCLSFDVPILFWRKDGSVLSVGTNSAFIINNAGPMDAGEYTVIASNSAGSVTSAVAILSVLPGPVTVAGNYSGLFLNSSDPTFASSGAFSAAVDTAGNYKGKLQIGRTMLPFGGKFSSDGRATNNIPRAGGSALLMELLMDQFGGNRIDGWVLEAGWTATLRANRAVFDARLKPDTAHAGAYTLVIAGGTNGVVAPIGDGGASLKISTAGAGVLSGMLADGSRVLQRGTVSSAGEFPVYVPLYGGRGAVFGWLRVKPSALVDLDGTLHWIRPTGPVPKTYPAGFHLVSPVMGSTFTPVGPGTWFETNAATLSMVGGNLAGPVTNSLVLSANGRVTGSGPDTVTMAVAPATGLFAGTVKPAGTTRSIKFQGVVLQRQGFGSGAFSGSNEVGHVQFAP